MSGDSIAPLAVAQLAEILCNDIDAREIAGATDQLPYADSAATVQAYWLTIASAALPTLKAQADALAALQAIADLTVKQQLPITSQVHVTAIAALSAYRSAQP